MNLTHLMLKKLIFFKQNETLEMKRTKIMSETVYDKLVKLQKMPRAWEDWKEYRSKLTDWIIEQTKKDSTVLITGAGACNDYDLVKMAGHFSKIYLLDIDTKSVECALTNQVKVIMPLTAQSVATASSVKTGDYNTFCNLEVFEVIEGDIVGISPTQYRRFAARLQSIVSIYGINTDLDELAKIAVEEMEDIYESRKDNGYLFKRDSVDYAIACGVHSQLNSMFPWIWDAYCQALGKQNYDVPMKAREFNNYFIPKFHELLFQAARKGVLIGLESSRVGTEGGVEGAFQGIQDIQKRIRLNQKILSDESSLLWPFNLREQIIYSMKLYSLKPLTNDS